jgi:hypothetical protein
VWSVGTQLESENKTYMTRNLSLTRAGQVRGADGRLTGMLEVTESSSSRYRARKRGTFGTLLRCITFSWGKKEEQGF